MNHILVSKLNILGVALLLFFSSSAFATLVSNIEAFNQAVETAKPGDTITLANGEWANLYLKVKALKVNL